MRGTLEDFVVSGHGKAEMPNASRRSARLCRLSDTKSREKCSNRSGCSRRRRAKCKIKRAGLTRQQVEGGPRATGPQTWTADVLRLPGRCQPSLMNARFPRNAPAMLATSALHCGTAQCLSHKWKRPAVGRLCRVRFRFATRQLAPPAPAVIRLETDDFSPDHTYTTVFAVRLSPLPAILHVDPFGPHTIPPHSPSSPSLHVQESFCPHN